MVQSLIGGDIVNQSREPELQGATVLEVLGGTGGSFVPPVSCKVVDRTLRGDNKHEYWRWLECSSTCLSTDCTGGTKLPPVPPNAGSDVPVIHNSKLEVRTTFSRTPKSWHLLGALCTYNLIQVSARDALVSIQYRDSAGRFPYHPRLLPGPSLH